MSSTLRSRATISDTTKFHHIKTVGYYNDTVGSTMPVPFICRNGVIDIHIEDNVESDLIENETAGDEYIEGLVKDMGGLTVVTRLGPNFIRWLNNWVADYYNDSVIDTFTVYVPATMTKVQATDEDTDDYNVLENDIDDEPWGISLEAPSGDGYVRGNDGNKFHTCWIFKTPLTVKFMLDGSPRYLTYNTTFAPMDD
jgi:hypothetical protein